MAKRNQSSGLEQKFTKELVLKGNNENYHELMNYIKRYTLELTNEGVTTHQIRNIFGNIKKAKKAEELWRLEVNLAYMAGRNEKKDIYKKLAKMLTDLIRATKTDDDLKKFKEFFTALVAYHKFNEKFKGSR